MTNSKQAPNPQLSSTKPYDLEERTFAFARSIRALVKLVPRTLSNIEDLRQLVRASGSVGANYIEANEALSKKDFLMRAKIARKEAKETRYWLGLIDTGGDAMLGKERDELKQEATELLSILSAIIAKTDGRNR